MVAIAFGFAHQNSLGKQSLPPQRDQSARVQMSGMNAPETHTGILNPEGPLDNTRCSEMTRNAVPRGPVVH